MNKHILIADDSSTIRKLIAIALKPLGNSVVTARDGMEALAALPHHQFDLLITDLNMPNVDGYELIRTIRGTEKYAHLPIIILSSERDAEDIKKGMEAGANSYLTKPFVPKRIQTEVAKYLQA